MLWRGLAALQRSMTAQISVSIALVSVLIITVFGTLIDQFLTHELREENELILIANLAFIRDDLAASGYDLAQTPHLVDRIERRVHRLHVAIFLDASGRQLVASSPNYAVPATALPQQVLAAELLPPQAAVTEFEGVRDRLGALTSIWIAPNGNHDRLLLGRIALPAQGAQPAGSLLVALAIEPMQTRELRMRDRRDLLVALAAAALLASVLGVWIARRIVVSARRLGIAASRIGAQALDERLLLDDTPTELLESTVAFNHMLDRLQNAFERLSAFSSDLAHDLRTPISTLLGEAQVVLSRPRSADEYRTVLESAVEEYERLSRTIANMLFLAHVDNDRAALSARWIELETALARVIGYFELLAEERGVVLQMALRAEPGVERRVWADETMLIRALSNLVSNALRYAPGGSCIELRGAASAGGNCILEVSNDGPAIAAQHKARIFERFYRADAARQDSASGSGLGLAIVRSIMELHRGTASVRSAPGQRTVFSLNFPAPPAA